MQCADMGYAYGYLLSEELSANYFSLISSFFSGMPPPKVRPIGCYVRLCCSYLLFQDLELVIGLALDWQWKDYLVSHLQRCY